LIEPTNIQLRRPRATPRRAFSTGAAAVLAGQQGDRRFVTLDLGSLKDVSQQLLAQRRHQPGELAGPASHHIVIDGHALAA
jgi:hypothetical protein